MIKVVEIIGKLSSVYTIMDHNTMVQHNGIKNYQTD